MPLDPRAIIANGESAKTEFKRDDRELRPPRLAREIVAFANVNGGMIVLGVDDDGTVSGVTRHNLQAWLMDSVIGRYVDPQLIPDYDEFIVDGKQIAIVTIPAGTAKPYGCACWCFPEPKWTTTPTWTKCWTFPSSVCRNAGNGSSWSNRYRTGCSATCSRT